MSRSYSEMGLTEEAQKWLKANQKMEVVPVRNLQCKNCGHIPTSEIPIFHFYEQHDLWYGEGPNLREFVLKDGKLCKEIIQCVPWSSGPYAFLCLELDGKKMFEWSEEEISSIV